MGGGVVAALRFGAGICSWAEFDIIHKKNTNPAKKNFEKYFQNLLQKFLGVLSKDHGKDTHLPLSPSRILQTMIGWPRFSFPDWFSKRQIRFLCARRSVMDTRRSDHVIIMTVQRSD